MSKSVSFEIELTLEEAAKIRRFDETEKDGVLFLLFQGLTNLKVLPKGLTNPEQIGA